MNVVQGEFLIPLDSSLLGPSILVLNCITKIITPQASLMFSLIVCLADYLLFFIMSSLDMKHALDVNIFTLKWSRGHPKCRNKNFGFNMNGTENENAIRNMKKSAKLLLSNYINWILFIKKFIKRFCLLKDFIYKRKKS